MGVRGGGKKVHYLRRVETPLLERSPRYLVRATFQGLSRLSPYGTPGRPVVSEVSKSSKKRDFDLEVRMPPRIFVRGALHNGTARGCLRHFCRVFECLESVDCPEPVVRAKFQAGKATHLGVRSAVYEGVRDTSVVFLGACGFWSVFQGMAGRIGPPF